MSSLRIVGLILDSLTSDPGSPENGETWHNSTENRIKIRLNGVTETLSHKGELDTHEALTNNPHTVTLEQARAANNVLTGQIDMGNQKIINLLDPTLAQDAATQAFVLDQIKQKLAGLDWQESVLDKDLFKPPATPATGDRYIVDVDSHAITEANTVSDFFKVSGDITAQLSVGEVFAVVGSTGNDGAYTINAISFAAGETQIDVTTVPDGTADGNIEFSEDAWNGKKDNIAEWDGTVWDFAVPNEGFLTRVEDENKHYVFDGVSWGLFDAVIDHGALIGLGDDDHTIYLLINGTRAMTGNLNLGGNNIITVGLVNGVAVEAHAARHNVGGADALTVTAPVEITDSTNAAGSGPGFAPGNHQHAHGSRGGGNLHAKASAAGDGFKPQSNLAATTDPGATDDTAAGYSVGSTWVNVTADTCFVAVDVTATAAIWKQVSAAGLKTKVGRKLEADFSGSPMTATVSFATAYPDTNYSITLGVEGSSNKHWAPGYNSKTTGGFTIELGSNSKANLVEVSWQAIADGES